jgi:hypothetical protein
MVTIVDHNSGFTVTVRKSLLVYRLEALKRRLIDAPYLRGRRLGRVATRRRYDVSGCGGSHVGNCCVEEKLRMRRSDHIVKFRRLRGLLRRAS